MAGMEAVQRTQNPTASEQPAGDYDQQQVEADAPRIGHDLTAPQLLALGRDKAELALMSRVRLHAMRILGAAIVSFVVTRALRDIVCATLEADSSGSAPGDLPGAHAISCRNTFVVISGVLLEPVLYTAMALWVVTDWDIDRAALNNPWKTRGYLTFFLAFMTVGLVSRCGWRVGWPWLLNGIAPWVFLLFFSEPVIKQTEGYPKVSVVWGMGWCIAPFGKGWNALCHTPLMMKLPTFAPDYGTYKVDQPTDVEWPRQGLLWLAFACGCIGTAACFWRFFVLLQREDDIPDEARKKGTHIFGVRSIKRIFAELDMDKNKVLSKEELQGLGSKLGRELTSKEVEKHFTDMDTDADNEITQHEFLAWWKKHEDVSITRKNGVALMRTATQALVTSAWVELLFTSALLAGDLDQNDGFSSNADPLLGMFFSAAWGSFGPLCWVMFAREHIEGYLFNLYRSHAAVDLVVRSTHVELSLQKDNAQGCLGTKAMFGSSFQHEEFLNIAKKLEKDAKEMMRCVPFENMEDQKAFLELCDQTLKGEELTKLQEKAFNLSREVAEGERIDFFISHNWADSPEEKHGRLCTVAHNFEKEHNRKPTFWFDRSCWNQNDKALIARALPCLPIFARACDCMLVLASEAYPTRLWCVWELYIFAEFCSDTNGETKFHLELMGGQTSTGNDASLETDASLGNDRDKMIDKLFGESFDVSKAECSDPEYQKILRSVIGVESSRRSSDVDELNRFIRTVVARQLKQSKY